MEVYEPRVEMDVLKPQPAGSAFVAQLHWTILQDTPRLVAALRIGFTKVILLGSWGAFASSPSNLTTRNLRTST